MPMIALGRLVSPESSPVAVFGSAGAGVAEALGAGAAAPAQTQTSLAIRIGSVTISVTTSGSPAGFAQSLPELAVIS